jgi:hypothetical protein
VHVRTVARDYVRAAVIGVTVGELDGARECVQIALTTYPTLLDDGAVAREIVRRYGRMWPAGEALRITRVLFDDVFPRSRRLESVRDDLFAEFHLDAIEAAQPGTARLMRDHVWPIVRTSPARLMNWGVLSRLLRQAVS